MRWQCQQSKLWALILQEKLLWRTKWSVDYISHTIAPIYSQTCYWSIIFPTMQVVSLLSLVHFPSVVSVFFKYSILIHFSIMYTHFQRYFLFYFAHSLSLLLYLYLWYFLLSYMFFCSNSQFIVCVSQLNAKEQNTVHEIHVCIPASWSAF